MTRLIGSSPNTYLISSFSFNLKLHIHPSILASFLTNFTSCCFFTGQLIRQAECHRDWPLYDDIFHPPPLRLESRKPLWRDMQSIDVTSRWRVDWQSATVVNSTLVVDPTIRLPGFDLHRRQWSLLNRFRTGEGHCNACHKKWGFTDNELFDCGKTQTMSHIVNPCPLTKFDGGLLCLHEADEAAVVWLTTYGS